MWHRGAISVRTGLDRNFRVWSLRYKAPYGAKNVGYDDDNEKKAYGDDDDDASGEMQGQCTFWRYLTGSSKCNR